MDEMLRAVTLHDRIPVIAHPERYEAVLNNNLMAMLFHVTGTDSAKELGQIDLASAVTTYLLDNGMSEQDILTLKEKLR